MGSKLVRFLVWSNNNDSQSVDSGSAEFSLEKSVLELFLTLFNHPSV